MIGYLYHRYLKRNFNNNSSEIPKRQSLKRYVTIKMNNLEISNKIF